MMSSVSSFHFYSIDFLNLLNVFKGVWSFRVKSLFGFLITHFSLYKFWILNYSFLHSSCFPPKRTYDLRGLNYLLLQSSLTQLVTENSMMCLDLLGSFGLWASTTCWVQCSSRAPTHILCSPLIQSGPVKHPYISQQGTENFWVA